MSSIQQWQVSINYLYPINDQTPKQACRMEVVLLQDAEAAIAAALEESDDERQNIHDQAYASGWNAGVASQRAAIAAAFQSGMAQMMDGIEQVSYDKGQADMLAKCIAELEALMAETDGDRFHGFWDAIAALRALEEKPWPTR